MSAGVSPALTSQRFSSEQTLQSEINISSFLMLLILITLVNHYLIA